MKYKVYKDLTSPEVVFSTNNKKEFLSYCQKNKIRADQCTVYDLVILGFDEV